MKLSSSKSNVLQIISIVLNAFLIVEVVLLVIQNKDLRTKLENHSYGPEALKQGETVPNFAGKTTEGNPFIVSYGDPNKTYLFFMLSTTCGICARNLENWNSIATLEKDPSTIIYGISTEDEKTVEKYVSAKTLSFHVATVSDTSFTRIYKLYGFPQTILVNGKGEVIKTWVGYLSPDNLSEMKKMLHLNNG